MNELTTRTLSAALLGVVVLTLTLVSFYSYALLIVVGTILLAKEWHGLTHIRGHEWRLIGIFYLGAAALSLLALRIHSVWPVLYLFLIVWTGDIAAYLIGRKYGAHKIAPSISPGKSWEGLIASIIASAAASAWLLWLLGMWYKFDSYLLLSALMGALMSVVGLLGDLFESSLKRHAKVKDSGTLIPGHGGLFDRVDALLPCAIFQTWGMGMWVFYAFNHMH